MSNKVKFKIEKVTTKDEYFDQIEKKYITKITKSIYAIISAPNEKLDKAIDILDSTFETSNCPDIEQEKAHTTYTVGILQLQRLWRIRQRKINPAKKGIIKTII